MRLNKLLAHSIGLSRRAADQAIQNGRVTIDGQVAEVGQDIKESDEVRLDGKVITTHQSLLTIMLNKPGGYVCSRDGQGSETVYDLLPDKFRDLKLVGRLDKDSSGLLLLTNDGDMAYKLTHPSFEKTKQYEITLDKPLKEADRQHITSRGVELEDGISMLELEPSGSHGIDWKVSMHEGRNRQIRRTFEALGHKVTKLHRTRFGSYSLGNLPTGKFQEVKPLEN